MESIIPPGIDAQSPWPAPGAETPLPQRKPTTPSGDDEDIAESPEDAEAEAPDTATPTPAPITAPAPGPAADDKAADDDGSVNNDASAPSHNGSSRAQISLVGAMVMGLASLFVAL